MVIPAVYNVLIRTIHVYIQERFKKFVDWRQCAAVMQRETVTVMSSCSGEGNVVVV
jgi:hypothetical protein